MLGFKDLEDLGNKYWEDTIIVHLLAEWSGTAYLMKNILKDVLSNYKNQVKLIEIDIDQDPQLANELSITVIPTLLLIHKSKLVQIYSGILSKQRLKAEIDLIILSN